MSTIEIPTAVGKYLMATLLDERMRSEHMDAVSRRQLAVALFGDNADFVDEADASPLAHEALREMIGLTTP